MENQCNFAGFVAGEPKHNNGSISFSIALKRKIKGEDHTTWVNAVLFGKSAEFNQGMQKGDMVVFSAEFQIDEYQGKSYPKFIVNRLKNFSEIKRKFSGNQQGQQGGYLSQGAVPQYHQEQRQSQAGKDDFIEDDIPF